MDAQSKLTFMDARILIAIGCGLHFTAGQLKFFHKKEYFSLKLKKRKQTKKKKKEQRRRKKERKDISKILTVIRHDPWHISHPISLPFDNDTKI